MGQVYLGRAARDDGELVAIKVIRPEPASDDRFRARFRREIEAAAWVPGEFTAAVVDADPEGSPPWLATRYVESRPLEPPPAGAESPWPLRRDVAGFSANSKGLRHSSRPPRDEEREFGRTSDYAH